MPEKLEDVDTNAFSGNYIYGIYIPGTNVNFETNAIVKNNHLVIIGEAGSTAETYAKDNDIYFHNVADTPAYQEATESTCVKEGNIEYWHCDVCGQDFSNAEGTKVATYIKVRKLPHDKEFVQGTLPTCTENGVKAHFYCKKCQKNYENSINSDNTEATDLTIPAKGHTEVKAEAIEPSCSEEGRTEGSYCSTCGAVIKEQEIIPKTAHGPIKHIEGVEATCTTAGIVDHYKCETCGGLFADSSCTDA